MQSLINYLLGVIMVKPIKLHLEDMGPISEADVNISKITLIAGHNSTGKSTLSKFLYSFLRSNSFNRQEIAYESITDLIESEAYYISRCFNRRTPSLKNRKNFKDVLNYYRDLKRSLFDSDIPEDELEESNEKMDTIDDLIRIVEDDSYELYVSLMRRFLESEFSSDNFNGYVTIDDTAIDFKNHDFNDNDAFRKCPSVLISDVFYIDSLSVLDTFEKTDRATFHLDFLKKNLTGKTRDVFDEKVNKDIIDLENDVADIINGRFVFERGEFKFISNSDIKSDMSNTASGIKQIGIIQLLLANRKLSKNSFLIIDEPEVNLHPDWQLRLARILVLIAKRLNVHVYINTHSPLFVEAVNTYADYYDMSEDSTYHMTHKSEKEGLFDISQTENLSEIYDNLGDPYFQMDVLRLEKELD